MVCDRSAANAVDLFDDLAGRLKHRTHLTNDGHSSYLETVETGFSGDVDYPILVKQCGNPQDSDRSAKARYSHPGALRFDLGAAPGISSTSCKGPA